jgi:hypothetical protein
MTTKVTVDAHAGWPVRVTTLQDTGHQVIVTVEPNAVQDFFVHSGNDLRVHEVQPDEKPTFGQKAVGASFNPSAITSVDRLKALYAEIIDLCAAGRAYANAPSDAVAPKPSPEAVRLYSIAITEAQGAQMWAVKAATWRD